MIKSMISSYLTQTTLTFFNNMFNKTNDKNFIIDPFTCMVRLSVLSFKPIGTKISVNDNKISFCEPGIFQGTLRWTYGDNREDLHNLFHPIQKALQWYDTKDPQIRSIFLMSNEGIDILKLAYKNNSLITHSLDLYKKFIDDHFNDNIKVEHENNNIENDANNKITKELKQLWGKNEILIIHNILTEMKSTDEQNLLALIKAIESILIIKELKVKNIIVNNTTLLN